MARASAIAALLALGAAAFYPWEGPPRPKGRGVVTLIPSHAEIVRAAGVDVRGEFQDVAVDVEKIELLNPELVYSSRSMMRRTNDALRAKGIAVRESDPKSWEDIAGEVRWFAAQFGGDPAAADRLLDRVRAVPKLPRPLRIAYVGYVAGGRGTTADLVIRTIGGINAIDADGWVELDREALLRANADVILRPDDVGPGIERPSPQLVEVCEWLSWRLR